jgi:uridine kinase
MEKLKAGKNVAIPLYDFKTHSRSKKTKHVYGADVIIVEGIFVLYDQKLRNLLDIKLFVDTAEDICLARRLRRDIAERGRDVTSVLNQYERFVKPAFEDFISPTKQYADIIIPRGADNKVAIRLVASHMQTQLAARGWNPDMQEQKLHFTTLPPNVHKLKENSQVRSIETTLRNSTTKRDDFIFNSERLVCLLIEEALNYTPFRSCEVMTPVNATYYGQSFHNQICGVSIMRAGDAMMKGFQSVLKDPVMGTMLIHSDNKSGPRLFFYRLPPDIPDYFVMLLDPTLGSGNTLIMAIRILLDHGFLEENIIFVTIIACQVGLSNVLYRHPKIHIVTAMIDNHLDKKGLIIPGIGHFGDRYYGTESDDTNED